MGRAVSVQQLPLRCVQCADDHPFGKSDEIRPELARLYRVPPNRDAPVEPEDTGTRRHRFQYRYYHNHGKRHESYDGQEIRGNVSADPRTDRERDRKSTRLNSSHITISYAVFCLKKKKK